MEKGKNTRKAARVSKPELVMYVLDLIEMFDTHPIGNKKVLEELSLGKQSYMSNWIKIHTLFAAYEKFTGKQCVIHTLKDGEKKPILVQSIMNVFTQTPKVEDLIKYLGTREESEQKWQQLREEQYEQYITDCLLNLFVNGSQTILQEMILSVDNFNMAKLDTGEWRVVVGDHVISMGVNSHGVLEYTAEKTNTQVPMKSGKEIKLIIDKAKYSRKENDGVVVSNGTKERIEKFARIRERIAQTINHHDVFIELIYSAKYGKDCYGNTVEDNIFSLARRMDDIYDLILCGTLWEEAIKLYPDMVVEGVINESIYQTCKKNFLQDGAGNTFENLLLLYKDSLSPVMSIDINNIYQRNENLNFLMAALESFEAYFEQVDEKSLIIEVKKENSKYANKYTESYKDVESWLTSEIQKYWRKADEFDTPPAIIWGAGANKEHAAFSNLKEYYAGIGKMTNVSLEMYENIQNSQIRNHLLEHRNEDMDAILGSVYQEFMYAQLEKRIKGEVRMGGIDLHEEVSHQKVTGQLEGEDGLEV